MSPQNLVSLSLLVGGAATAAAGLWLLFKRAWPEADPRGSARPELDAGSGSALAPRASGAAIVAALLITAAGFLLGFEGLERRGMSHVEVYVPGIDLPAGISEPPPRRDLLETISWHWHREPHPQGYYFLMWGWTKAFGTSLAALRLPSLLFGAASVLLIFVVGAREYGAGAGLLAAGLLAFNGHQIYWSQSARMYMMSAFLALLSLWFLLGLLKGGRRRRWLEVGYVVVTTWGVFTQLYFWPFLAAQMVFAAVARSRDGAPLRRLFSLQALCVILGSPLWAHAVYRARQEPQSATLSGLPQDYLNFGFLFLPDDWSPVPRNIPWLPEAGITLVVLVALYFFFRSRRHGSTPERGGTSLPYAPLFLVAGGAALVILALAREANRRQALMALTALVPLLAAVGAVLFDSLEKARPTVSAEAAGSPWLSPVVWCGLGTAALVFLVGLFEPFLTARGLLVAVPPLLLILAAGLRDLLRKVPMAGVPVLLLVAGASVASILHYRALPGPNDHRSVAAQLQARFRPGDVVLVRSRDWVTTPIFYHLEGDWHRLVADDYVDRVEAYDATRVWVLRFSDRELPTEMERAVEGFEAVEHLSALRVEATLFRRPDRLAAP